MTKITQADRDAAEEHFDLWYPNTAWGYEPLVEAFARHRQQSTEALQAENAKLREALRRISIGDGIGGPDAELQCADIARKALQETGQ